MSNRDGIARHRAEATKTSSIAVIAKAVSDNAGGVGRQAAVIAAASGLVLTTGIAANAAQPVEVQPDTNTSTLKVQANNQGVTASSKVQITFESPKASSSVPAVVTPVVKVESNNTTPVAAPAAQAPAAQAPAAQTAAAPAAATTETAAAQPAAAKPASQKSGIGATIAAAAYAQLGVAQDCTALASNSLAAAGIFYHGWPAGYLSLGRTISESEAQPGDLIYYANGGGGQAHIAVYVGNGQAVHGGWNGYTTAVFSAHVGSGPVFIAIGH